MKSTAKQLFWNALLLTLSSLLMRTVGVWFQVYLSNRVGAEAMGLYSLMLGVYGFALTLATSGIHLGVTRLIADALGREQPQRIPAIMRSATLYALFFGLLSSLLLGGFATPIGNLWLKDARTVPSLRLLAVTLPLIALASAWGGYFTAVRRVYKNAAVQIWEQLLKIGGTMYLLSLFGTGAIETLCCLLVAGGAIAEIGSFLVNGGLYLRDRRRHFSAGSPNGWRKSSVALARISLPIALTTYLRSGLLTLQHILIPEGLRNSGTSHGQALAAYGSIHSMALPVILYPSALIGSFSGLLVPALAECAVQKRPRRIRYMIGRVWSLALLFAICTAGILICFSQEIGTALYPGTRAGYYIRLLAPLIPIMYIDTATDAMMKGLGEQVYSMNINLADAAISVLLVWLLIPRYGITGYIVTIYFSEIFNTVFSIAHLLSVGGPQVRLLKWIYKPLLSIVIATLLCRALFSLLPLPLAPGLSFLIHALTTGGFYLLGLLLLGSLEREDLHWIGGLFQREPTEAHPQEK